MVVFVDSCANALTDGNKIELAREPLFVIFVLLTSGLSDLGGN
jgi:hypothetical protein